MNKRHLKLQKMNDFPITAVFSDHSAGHMIYEL